MLPLGIVIPTKNSMAYLPRHVEGLRPWLDLVEQIVVVDSFSNDGTVEYLREHLRHPRVNFISHPPGLYASWNHGIAQISSKYVFIATTGDLITRTGITHLVETAEAMNCDVVISKPKFQDQQGRTVKITWPIDDVIASLDIRAPRRLHKLEAVVFAAVHATGALLGSCASNIFRTEVLKQFPFPTDFGTSGDGAWGWKHAAEVVWGVSPEKFSTFLVHPSSVSVQERAAYAQARRVDEVLRSSASGWLISGAVTKEDLARVGWDRLLSALSNYLDAKSEFDCRRKDRAPWVLNPLAWRARAGRAGTGQQLHELKRGALGKLNPLQELSAVTI